MARAILWDRLRAHVLRHSGPATVLGRWCGPWYTPACDVMKKGRLADMDNSVWDHPPPRAEPPEDPPRRDPINVFVVS